MKSPICVVLEPQHEYALALIDRMFVTYGVPVVCVYSDARSELQSRRLYPSLGGKAVAASYCVPTPSLPEFARYLRRHYNVRGIVPPTERDVSSATLMLPELRLTWNDRAVLARFRDKYALKRHLQSVRPDLNITRVARIERESDIDALGSDIPTRFVLKPVDGYGLREVAVFTSDERRRARAHVAAHPSQTFVLEEFVDGDEYMVNGQVDADGVVHVYHVIKYQRTTANGRRLIYWNDLHVHADTPEFDQLAGYAREVMQASGLVRSPFHMEVMLNARGPWLIEVGARLAGGAMANACNDVHAGALDVFDQAVQGYLFDTVQAPPRCDWRAYNALNMVVVSGIAARREAIYALSGVDEVEAMPEFLRWVHKPDVGEVVVPTVDMFSHPYIIQMLARRRDTDVCALADEVRKRIGWNLSRSRAREAAAELRAQVRRYSNKFGWLAANSRLLELAEAEAPLPEWTSR